MRCRVLIVLALALGLPQVVPLHAQTGEDQVRDLLKAASSQSAIITFCGKHFTIDGTTALRISKTSRDVAAKVLGQDQAEAAFKDELARRYDEVRQVGEQQWCTDQREAFADDGIGIFKN